MTTPATTLADPTESDRVRAVTIHQPYAAAIVLGLKTTENRPSRWRVRGRTVIHAGTRWNTAGADDPKIVHAFWRWLYPSERHANRVDYALHPDLFPLGAFVGAVDILGAHDPTDGCCPWGLDRLGGRPVRTHLDLGNAVRLMEPIPARGLLGVWHAAPGQVERLREGGVL